MIGVLNKIILSLLIISFTVSCVKTETKTEKQEYSEIGRYEVIEIKDNPDYLTSKRLGLGDIYYHSYYLLDTKTGELKEIDWSELE